MSDGIQQILKPTVPALSHHRAGDKDPRLVGALSGWLQHGGGGGGQCEQSPPCSSYNGCEPGVGQRPAAMEMAALPSPAPLAAPQPRHRHKPHLYASIPTGPEPISTLKMQKS